MPSLILPNRELVVQTEITRTTTGFSGDHINRFWRGIVLYIDVSAVSGGSPTLIIAFQSKDPVTGDYTSHGNITTITSVEARGAAFVPEIVESAGARFSRVVTQTWRMLYTIGGTTPSFTFTIGGSYVP